MQKPRVPWVEKFAGFMAHWAGHPLAFFIALSFVFFWALSGPMFGFSDTWQLIINTTTTILTFLLGFLIQHTQNKDSVAIQTKLNELIATTAGASNRLIDLEMLSDREINELHDRYEKLSKQGTLSESIATVEAGRKRHRARRTRGPVGRGANGRAARKPH